MEPADIGLPQSSFRPVQLYALDRLMDTDRRVVLLQAPTGSGKSVIAAAFAKLLGARCVYTCVTIDLQRQFCASVPWAKEIKGRSRYPTLDYPHLFPEITCEDCDKSKSRRRDDSRCTWCSSVPECPYERAKAEALRSGMAVLNVAYFLHEANHVGRFSGWDLAVLDEGDEIERQLMDFVSVEFSDRTLRYLDIRPPEFKGTTANVERRREEWGEWFDQVASKLDGRIREAKDLCQSLARTLDPGGWDAASTTALAYARAWRRLGWLERMRKKVSAVMDDLSRNPESWVRVDDQSLTFKPVKVDRYASDFLWRHAKRWLVMSATLVSKEQFCEDMGLHESDVAWIDLPSTFPVAHRPVFYWPAAEVTYRTKVQALPRVVERLDRILDAYAEHRVLVHTHTYEIARYIASRSRHKDRILTYADRDEYPAVLEAFRVTDRAVLVAPSMERGVDLPDDLCRCVVVCKIPFPNLADRQVRARFKTRWYDVQTVRALVQMTGRGCRSEDDWADSWILDAEFARLRKRAWHLFPSWWMEALTIHPASIQAALERRAKNAPVGAQKRP